MDGIYCLFSAQAIDGKSAVRGYKYARDMLDDRTNSGSAIVSDEERLVGGASRSMTQVVGDMSVFAIVLDLASLRRLLIAVFILSSLPCYRCLDLGKFYQILPSDITSFLFCSFRFCFVYHRKEKSALSI